MTTNALTKTHTLTELVTHYNIEDEILRSQLRGLLVTYPALHTALWLDVTQIRVKDGKPVAIGATVIENLSVATGVQLNNGKLYIQISYAFDDGLVISETNALPTDKLNQAESLIAAMGADVLTRYQAVVAERTRADLAKQEHEQAEERTRTAKLEAAQRLIDTAQDFVLAWTDYTARRPCLGRERDRTTLAALDGVGSEDSARRCYA